MKLLNDQQLAIFKDVINRTLHHIIIDEAVCADSEKFKTVISDLILNYDLQIPELAHFEKRILEHGIISCLLTPDEIKKLNTLPYIVGIESERFAKLEK